MSKYPDVPAILREEFIQGSRADLELVTNKIVEQYNSDVGDEYAREWELGLHATTSRCSMRCIDLGT